MLGYHVNLLSVTPVLRITLLNKVKIEHKYDFTKYQVHFCPCETDEGCNMQLLSLTSLAERRVRYIYR